MANYYVSSARWAALTPWSAGQAVTVGTIRRQLASVTLAVGRVFRCTTAGTTGASEPTWSLGNNATTNDNGVVWTQCGGQEAHQAPGAWNPLASHAAVISVFNPAVSDVCFFAHDHNQNETGSLTISGGNLFDCISVDAAAATIPPAASDYKRGAKLQAGAGLLNLASGRFFGFDFSAGDGTSSTSHLDMVASSGAFHADDCTFTLNNTSATSRIRANGTLYGSVNWTRCKVVLKGNQAIQLGHSTFQWVGSPDADTVTCTGTTPVGLFDFNRAGKASIRGVNLSGFTGTNYVYDPGSGRTIVFEHCILNPAVTKFERAGYTDFLSQTGTAYINCDDAVSDRPFGFENNTIQGVVATRMDLARDSGAEIDGQNYSLEARFITSSYQNNHIRFPQAQLWNDVVGTPITVTMFALEAGGSGAVLKRDFYIDVEALTGSTKFLHELHTSFVHAHDPAVCDTDNSSWTLGVPYRANSTSYPQFSIVRVASNPGRVFIRLAGGSSTSAASEPAGFATAVDGDTVTDGSAVWIAARRIKTSVTFTPTYKGVLKVQPRIRYTPTRLRAFVDPKPVVT